MFVDHQQATSLADPLQLQQPGDMLAFRNMMKDAGRKDDINAGIRERKTIIFDPNITLPARKTGLGEFHAAFRNIRTNNIMIAKILAEEGNRVPDAAAEIQNSFGSISCRPDYLPQILNFIFRKELGRFSSDCNILLMQFVIFIGQKIEFGFVHDQFLLPHTETAK